MLHYRLSTTRTSVLKHAILGGFVLCAVALPVQAQTPTPSHKTLEYQVINQIHHLRSRSKTPLLKYDDQASVVARQHAEAMAETGQFSLTLPELGSLNDQLNYARISARPLHTFIALGKTPRDIFNQIQKLPALKDREANTIALGLGQGEHPQMGNVYWATVILLDRMVDIVNLPREVRVGQSVRVQVKYSAPLRNPRLPVTAPSGFVQRIQPLQARPGQADFELRFTEKGRYAIEVLMDEPGVGPRVARILPVYAGESYPRRESEYQNTATQFKDTRTAANHLFALLNQERKKMGLNAVNRDAILEKTAVDHSRDMALRGFFAHVTPDGKNPNTRYQAHGGFGTVGENIVIETNIDKAHRQLMASPGHRANILQADVTHVGMGLYYAKDRYYITQLFQSRQGPQDLRVLKERLGSWLDNYRAQHDVGILLKDDLLQSINQEYTRKMAQQDRLDYTGTKALGPLYADRGGHYGQMSTVVFSARDFDDVVSKLEKYKNLLQDERWERYGLGIAQANSVTQGHHILWVTLGLARD